MTPDRISEIKERLAKASPGPWAAKLMEDDDEDRIDLLREVGVYYSGGDGIRYVLAADEVDDSQQTPNVDLIANAPADLQFLLAQVEEMGARLERAIPNEPTVAMVRAAWEASEMRMELGMDKRRVDLPVVRRILVAALYALAHDGECLCRNERGETCEVCQPLAAKSAVGSPLTSSSPATDGRTINDNS
jgi:hypothetical protein